MKFFSISGKKWIFKKYLEEDVKKYAENYSINEISARLLAIRKENIEDINLFLNPTIKNNLPNPFKLKDMKSAVDRVYDSINKKEIFGIFGDYDVDGASSTALLAKYFTQINQKIKIYIPDRKNEGYGPSVSGFNFLAESFFHY